MSNIKYTWSSFHSDNICISSLDLADKFFLKILFIRNNVSNFVSINSSMRNIWVYSSRIATPENNVLNLSHLDTSFKSNFSKSCHSSKISFWYSSAVLLQNCTLYVVDSKNMASFLCQVKSLTLIQAKVILNLEIIWIYAGFYFQSIKEKA